MALSVGIVRLTGMRAEKSDLRIAAVGLIGAIIGGLLSTGGVIYSEHSQAQREDRRELRAAVGSARLMVDEYRSAGLYLERCIRTGKLWPVPPEAAIAVADNDRKLMVAHLEPDAYGRASEATVNTNLILRALRRADRPEGAYPLLGRHEEITVRAALQVG